eukprot:scaffold1439_cov404-Prasinococcus_capsulatus_cf.AAC.8
MYSHCSSSRATTRTPVSASLRAPCDSTPRMPRHRVGSTTAVRSPSQRRRCGLRVTVCEAGSTPATTGGSCCSGGGESGVAAAAAGFSMSATPEGGRITFTGSTAGPAPPEGSLSPDATVAVAPTASEAPSSATPSSTATGSEKQLPAKSSVKASVKPPAKSEPAPTDSSNLIVGAAAVGGLALVAAAAFVWRKKGAEWQAMWILTGSCDCRMRFQAMRERQLRQQSKAMLNEVISQIRSYDFVDLQGKNLGDEAVSYCAEALAFNTIAVGIDLGNNAIGPQGMQYICK